jgi:hypothetical protein
LCLCLRLWRWCWSTGVEPAQLGERVDHCHSRHVHSVSVR